MGERALLLLRRAVGGICRRVGAPGAIPRAHGIETRLREHHAVSEDDARCRRAVPSLALQARALVRAQRHELEQRQPLPAFRPGGLPRPFDPLPRMRERARGQVALAGVELARHRFEGRQVLYLGRLRLDAAWQLGVQQLLEPRGPQVPSEERVFALKDEFKLGAKRTLSGEQALGLEELEDYLGGSLHLVGERRSVARSGSVQFLVLADAVTARGGRYPVFTSSWRPVSGIPQDAGERYLAHE